jgi:uncharacterized protein
LAFIKIPNRLDPKKNFIEGEVVRRIFIITIVLVFSSCGTQENITPQNKKYLSEISEWHNNRINNLIKESGWLNLIGLHWLKEGENTFGADKSNDIVFPPNRAPEFIGRIVKKDSIITTFINKDVKVFMDEDPIKNIVMNPDISGDPTVLNYNSLRWFIIKRGDKYGIRLRDLKADLLENFEGIEKFEIDESWKLNARFEKYEPPKKIMIPTILGNIEEAFSPGKLIFNINDKEYSLDPTSAGEGLFIVFADLTSGEESYGAGRFLYVDGPDSNNNVILDFNKAYNPPCAFTKFATCPLPPEENKIRVRIAAGEKKFH